MLSEPLQITQKVISAFDTLHIPYLIGGSLASSVYGTLRSTLDADLIADIKLDDVSQFVTILKNEFYIDSEKIVNAIEDQSNVNIIHINSMFTVDIFILKHRDFDLNQMKRRKAKPVGDNPEQSLYFSSPEDLVLAKLEWYQAGGEVSERQWRDVVGVLKIQKEQLDYLYLNHWAKQLNVQYLLDRALIDVKYNKSSHLQRVLISRFFHLGL
jgi:hypothetical protein